MTGVQTCALPIFPFYEHFQQFEGIFGRTLSILDDLAGVSSHGLAAGRIPKQPAERIGQTTLVTDFVSGTDSLGVLASESAGRLVAGQAVDVVAASEIANASHAGSAGYFIFDNSGADAGMVYWDATGGNGADATAVIKLAGVSNLLSSDFHVI